MIGKILYRFSPSQIKTWRLCARKWAFEKIEKITAPTTPKMQFGTDRHAEAEAWLKHGEKPGPVVAQGIKKGMMPTPGPHLLVEEHIELQLPDLPDDTRLIGIIDCVEPPNLTCPIPLVVDHKFTSDLKWAISSPELAIDPQGLIYSKWAMLRYRTDQAAARWGYYEASNPKTGPRKPTGVRPVDHVFCSTTDEFRAAWDALIRDILEMREAKIAWHKANTDAPPNPKSCNAFGGCPHRDICNLDSGDVLAAHIEQFDREHGSRRLTLMSQCDNNSNHKEGAMGNLFDKLKTMKTTADAGADALKPEGKDNNVSKELLNRLQSMSAKQGVNPPEGAQAKEGCDEVGTPDYDEMSVKELKALYQERTGAKPPFKWRRADLVEELFDLGAATPEVVASTGDTATEKAAAEHALKAEMLEQGAAMKTAEHETGVGQVAAQPDDSAGLMVLFDCALRKGPNANGHKAMINLADWVKPVADAVARDNGVEHFGLIDFAKGGPMLAAKVERYIQVDKGLTGVLLVDSYSLEGRALKDVLIRYATIVVQGVR